MGSGSTNDSAKEAIEGSLLDADLRRVGHELEGLELEGLRARNLALRRQLRAINQLPASQEVAEKRRAQVTRADWQCV